MTLSTSLETLGAKTFEGCSSLTAIEIPASLTTIDENDYERYSYHTSPFTGSAITDVSFEAGRTSIPWYLFADMTKLTGIRLPKSLKTINGEAFRGGVFRYAKAGDALRTVGAYAFAECPNLSYVYLPSAVETIDAHAFADSTGVTIIGERGSAAETFARANGIPFAATA